jgi:hypothetical protein
MRILIGAMLLLLEVGALACSLKALGEPSERGSFVSTLFLGGMAGKEQDGAVDDVERAELTTILLSVSKLA